MENKRVQINIPGESQFSNLLKPETTQYGDKYGLTLRVKQGTVVQLRQFLSEKLSIKGDDSLKIRHKINSDGTEDLYLAIPAVDKKGKSNKPAVTDSFDAPITTIVGRGSQVKVLVDAFAYDFNGKKGVALRPLKVVVTELKALPAKPMTSKPYNNNNKPATGGINIIPGDELPEF